MSRHIRLPKVTFRPQVPRLKVAVFSVVAIILLASLGFILWLGYIRPQPQVFAGINLTRRPLIVSIAGQQKLLNLYDTYHVVVTISGTVELTVADAEGNLLESREYIVNSTPGLGIDFFVEDEQLAQCIISANVTGMYYQVDSSAVYQLSTVPTDIQVVAAAATKHYYTTWDKLQKEYVFLDSYDGNHLPFHLDRTYQAYGYYPVPCDDLGDQEKLVEWINWWRNYNPSVQRELYHTELERIEATTFYQ